MDGTLGKKCYDQSPCGLACTFGKSLGMTIEHCRDLIKGDRLKGFFMARWYYCSQEGKRGEIMESFKMMAKEISRARERD